MGRRYVGEDRLTELPDLLLGHILSAMPTKDAVRTSILSKAWEYKWTFIYNIQVTDNFYSKEETSSNFVERILYLTCNSELKSLRLSFRSIRDNPRIGSWIAAAIWRNVQNLEITCQNRVFVFILPRSLSSSTSLTELKIRFPCVLRVSTSQCFPNLKSLYLGGGAVILNRQSTSSGELLLSLPVLERLHLGECHWLNVDALKILAPAIISFIKVKNGYGTDTYENYLQKFLSIDVKLSRNLTITIAGNKLEKFESSDGMIDQFVLSAPSAYYAKLYHRDVDEEHASGSRAFQVLNGLPGLKHLQVTGDLIKAMINSDTGLPPTLNKYEVLDIHHVTVKEFMELLKFLPSLETLIVNVDADYFDCEDFVCEEVESWSSCIVSRLKCVTIKGFHGCEAQMHLAKFLLGNAANLAEVTIKFSPIIITMKNQMIFPRSQIMAELATCPRRSGYVAVEYAMCTSAECTSILP